jgi:hypothetical protein
LRLLPGGCGLPGGFRLLFLRRLCLCGNHRSNKQAH